MVSRSALVSSIQSICQVELNWIDRPVRVMMRTGSLAVAETRLLNSRWICRRRISGHVDGANSLA